MRFCLLININYFYESLQIDDDMKIEWTKLKPSEFYLMIMNDNVGGKNISTRIGYYEYTGYYFKKGQMGIFLYTYFEDNTYEDNIPMYLTKEEFTEHFKIILRKDKLEKIMKKI
jgi:hypothetical protein